jgi:hypothetical protein
VDFSHDCGYLGCELPRIRKFCVAKVRLASFFVVGSGLRSNRSEGVRKACGRWVAGRYVQAAVKVWSMVWRWWCFQEVMRRPRLG